MDPEVPFLAPCLPPAVLDDPVGPSAALVLIVNPIADNEHCMVDILGALFACSRGKDAIRVIPKGRGDLSQVMCMGSKVSNVHLPARGAHE